MILNKIVFFFCFENLWIMILWQGKHWVNLSPLDWLTSHSAGDDSFTGDSAELVSLVFFSAQCHREILFLPVDQRWRETGVGRRRPWPIPLHYETCKQYMYDMKWDIENRKFVKIPLLTKSVYFDFDYFWSIFLQISTFQYKDRIFPW